MRGEGPHLLLLMIFVGASCARTPLDDGIRQPLGTESTDAGASSSDSAASPPPSPPARTGPIFWFEPGDLLAETTVTPIRGFLATQSHSILLAAVAAEVQLHEYPSMKPVEITVTTSVTDRSNIEIEPRAPLAQSWHVVSLKHIPEGISLSPYGAPTPPIGEYANRFHQGTGPVLRRMTFCESTSLNRLFYSQNTMPGGLVTIRQPSTQIACQLGTQPSPSWLEMICPHFQGTDTKRQIVFDNVLAAGAGTPFTMFPSGPVNFVVDLATLPLDQEGCKLWQP